MKKKGKLGAIPSGQKQVRIVERGDGLYRLHPKWSFVKCDMQHEKWGISANADCLLNMLERFKNWELITWGEILTTTAGRKSNTQSHPMEVGILDREAQERLEELNLGSPDILYSLAISGRQRVWGLMVEETGTFQLLWCDPRHEIYPVER